MWHILAGRMRELLLCPDCHESIFTNPQQKNITILTDRRMIHSVCLECPATKAEEKNDVSQIKLIMLPSFSDSEICYRPYFIRSSRSQSTFQSASQSTFQPTF